MSVYVLGEYIIVLTMIRLC